MEKATNLERTMAYLQKQFDSTNREIYLLELQNVKNQMELLIEESAQSTAFRSHAKHYAEGERITKYFFNLAKSRYHNRVMYEVKDEKGQLVTSPEAVLKTQYDYYAKLYKANLTTNFSLTNIKGKESPPKIKEMLERDLDIEELYEAVKHFKDDKTPGVDGLTAALYKNYWNLLSNQLMNACNFAFEKKQLHISARRGVLSLIPKKCKDAILIKNWRHLLC